MKTNSIGGLFTAALIACCFMFSLAPTVQGKDEPAVKEVTYPKPDLAIVEKHFKVVKYEYDDVKERLVMTLVPLTDSVPSVFKVKHYDADGARIDFDATLHYYNAAIGEQKTCSFHIPRRFMALAKKAVISRP